MIRTSRLTDVSRWMKVAQITLVVLAKRPRPVMNKRVPVANSRYNPHFAGEIASASIEA